MFYVSYHSKSVAFLQNPVGLRTILMTSASPSRRPMVTDSLQIDYGCKQENDHGEAGPQSV